MKLSRMRPSILCFIAAASLAVVPAAVAAPTCQDQSGHSIKCGTDGAMPVGWTLPADELFARQASEPEGPSASELFELVSALGLFFALLALMPEFDGWGAGDWGKQEDDSERD